MKDYTKPELVEMESIPVEGVYAGSGDVEEEQPAAPAGCPKNYSSHTYSKCRDCQYYNQLWGLGNNTCSLGLPAKYGVF